MDDRSRVEELIGRPPRGDFDVVVRDADGDPVVVRNAPLLQDGTPMPTRYYLVGLELVRAVSRIEAAGGVRRAEAEIAPAAIARAHEVYRQERDSALPSDHVGPRPHGGVGGTRLGVKCLHAHLAHTLAGGDDPVGMWTLAHLVTDGAPLADLDPPAPPTAKVTAQPVNADTDGLSVHIDDDRVDVMMTAGGSWQLPIGPVSLLDRELEHKDPPPAANLTNALGIVHDHFDDVVVNAPSVLAAPSVVFSGHHAEAVANVEVGGRDVPDDYQLTRGDADEVFRTLVAEPLSERRFNPGLDEEHVETIIATLCIVLAIMRRLELSQVGIAIERSP